MALTIEREQEFVNQFHYDARNYEWEKENGTPETNLNVQFQLVPKEQLEKLGEGDTGIHAVLTYLIVLDNIVLSGFVSQLNYAAPLFELLKPLVYETTEVALDQPGINLEF